MLKIYAIPVSLYCAKLRIVLRHNGLDWVEEPPPGGYGSSTYREIVPSGNLPALVDGDLLLADSEAIAEYLNEAHPAPALLPEDIHARAKCRELARFHDTRLEPAVRATFKWIGDPNRDREVLEQQAALVAQRLTQLSRMLADRPNQFSLADCGYPVTLSWINALSEHFNLAIPIPEPVTTYLQALGTQPAVKRELESYVPRLKEWLAAQ